MEKLKHYFETNKKLWDNKTPIHIKSEFYDMPSFIQGQTSLRKIELELLENMEGKKVLHTQCHFGQDTLSLERMGGICTGVDFSDGAIAQAREIRDQLNLNTKFICCNIYDLDKHCDELFDIVFTTYGVITWLPDLNLWAKQLSNRLKPGGKLYFVELHPFFYMFDWEKNAIGFSYFNDGDPNVEIEKGTYADTNADIEMKEYFWQHSLSEIFNALITNGLNIKVFNEYDYSPYHLTPSMVKRKEQEYIYKPFDVDLPHTMAIVAEKTKPIF